MIKRCILTLLITLLTLLFVLPVIAQDTLANAFPVTVTHKYGTTAIDPAPRGQIRDELDALVAHLYGLAKEDYAHILKTFPLVFPSMPAGVGSDADIH